MSAESETDAAYLELLEARVDHLTEALRHIAIYDRPVSVATLKKWAMEALAFSGNAAPREHDNV
jgi:hypothetical protein